MRGKHAALTYFDVPILAGKYKGKRIRIPDIVTTRSSKSILRESLFDTLQFDIIGKRFVEVFAGSGSVGIEAISRGAGHGYFLERNREVFALLRHNIFSIDSEASTPILGDSFETFLPLLERLKEDNVPTYFYCDPPFSIREGMDDIYRRTLELIQEIPAHIGEKVMIEHMTQINLPETIGDFQRIKKKRFGKSTLSYYAPILPG